MSTNGGCVERVPFLHEAMRNITDHALPSPLLVCHSPKTLSPTHGRAVTNRSLAEPQRNDTLEVGAFHLVGSATTTMANTSLGQNGKADDEAFWQQQADSPRTWLYIYNVGHATEAQCHH